MVDKFEVSDDGIDPVQYIKDYFSHLTTKEISVLVGSIALLERVDLKILQGVLELDQIEVEEKIGRLLQTDLLEGFFEGNEFILDHFNYAIVKQHPNLTLDDRTFLAYLKSRFRVTLKELQETFNLSYASTIYLLSRFIARGMISPIQEKDQQFKFIVHFHYDKRSAEDVTALEKQVVGYLQLTGQHSIEEVAVALEEPEHKILSTLTTLILSDMVLAKFNSQNSFFGSRVLNIEIDKFQVYFGQRSVQVLTDAERKFIGYLSLRKKSSIDQICHILSKSRAEIIKLAASLHSTNQMKLSLENDNFRVSEIRPLSANRSLDILSKIHSFNYRMLIGLIQTQNRISIKDIADKMEIEKDAVIDALIACYIEGLIDGHLNNRNIFSLKAVRRTENQSEITLDRWERIMLGCLMSEKVISWPKIAALLEVDRTSARNHALEFISRGISKTTAKDSVLILQEEPNLPPLVQIHKLDLLDRQIFGYIKLEMPATVKTIRSVFGLSTIEVYRKMYYLAGSGLFKLDRDSDQFIIKEIPKFDTQISINELDLVSQQIIRSIEQSSSPEVVLSELAREVELNRRDLLMNLFDIIANGLYEGKIEKDKFIRTSRLLTKYDSGYCLYCSESLDADDRICQNCGEMIPLCGVCKGRLNSNEQLLACPKCKNLSHSNHIKQWLQIKGQCPFCRSSIGIRDLLVQQPLL